MKKYKKKPIVIEAMQFTDSGSEQLKVSEWVEKNGSKLGLYDGFYRKGIASWEKAFVDTLEGSMMVSIGDWIIKGVEGEFYPCKDSVFKKTYDEVK
jgi:hypothetical protein